MGTRSSTIYDLIPSWKRSLRARNRAEATIVNYTAAAQCLADWLVESDLPSGVEAIEPKHIDAFTADQLNRLSSSTAATRYRFLQQFFKWATAEGEIESSPMANLAPPAVEEKLVPIISDADLIALLDACDGKEFTERRDTAIVRLLLDSGLRAGEITAIALADVDIDDGAVVVTGKGNKPRICPFGYKTAEALDRYLRTRGRHKLHARPELWLSPKGALSQSGLAQVLNRRAAQAGIGKLHPHMFRHTFSHRWLANGGNESDLQALAGWSSNQMIQRYGASARSERARQAHERMALGDLL